MAGEEKAKRYQAFDKPYWEITYFPPKEEE
jgi:hypothetical protein